MGGGRCWGVRRGGGRGGSSERAFRARRDGEAQRSRRTACRLHRVSIGVGERVTLNLKARDRSCDRAYIIGHRDRGSDAWSDGHRTPDRTRRHALQLCRIRRTYRLYSTSTVIARRRRAMRRAELVSLSPRQDSARTSRESDAYGVPRVARVRPSAFISRPRSTSAGSTRSSAAAPTKAEGRMGRPREAGRPLRMTS